MTSATFFFPAKAAAFLSSVKSSTVSSSSNGFSSVSVPLFSTSEVSYLVSILLASTSG